MVESASKQCNDGLESQMNRLTHGNSLPIYSAVAKHRVVESSQFHFSQPTDFAAHSSQPGIAARQQKHRGVIKSGTHILEIIISRELDDLEH